MIRKAWRSVDLETMQWTGDNLKEIETFLGTKVLDTIEDSFYVNFPSGKRIVRIGDFVIKEPTGETYPCKKHTFEETYVYLTNLYDESMPSDVEPDTWI